MATPKSAIHGEYIIEIKESGKVEIYRIYNNTLGAIREIAKQVGFEIDPNWNTQSAGRKLVDFLNSIE